MANKNFRIIKFQTVYKETYYQVCEVTYGLSGVGVQWEPVPMNRGFGSLEAVKIFMDAGNLPILVFDDEHPELNLTEARA